jgi:hypothetical protein
MQPTAGLLIFPSLLTIGALAASFVESPEAPHCN